MKSRYTQKIRRMAARLRGRMISEADIKTAVDKAIQGENK